MQKTILIYALGAVVLVGAILYAVSLSPIFKTQGSATAVNTPNAPETTPRDKPKKKGDAKSEPYYLDDSFLKSIEGLVAGQVPEGRDHLFYARLRARLSTELARLQDGSNDAARQALEERIATVDRNLLFVEDTPYQQRIKPLFEYCKFLMNKRDVAGLVALQKEVENANWKEAEEKDNLHCRNLAFIPKTYRVKTEIAKAIDEKDDQRLESFFPELEALAMEDRDNPVDSVRAKLKDYLDPIANYSQELGNKAKIAMRRGFYRAQLRLNDESLTPKYSPKNATILVGGSELSYDQTLLDVPKDETTAFYKARIAQLQNLLMRVPADSDAEPVKALREKAETAFADAYENYALAVDMLPSDKPFITVSGEAPSDVLRTACQKLTELGEVERLQRLAERDDYRPVVENFILQARMKRASETNGPASADADATIDEAVQWATTEPDDALVVQRVESLLAQLEKTDDGRQKVDAAKAKFRDAFKNAKTRSKRRLVYIDALK